MVGNPITDPMFDDNFRIPSAHGFGIISDQTYEVMSNVTFIGFENIVVVHYCSMCRSKNI